LNVFFLHTGHYRNHCTASQITEISASQQKPFAFKVVQAHCPQLSVQCLVLFSY